MLKLAAPATSPFTQAMTIASLVDTFSVRLLSMAHRYTSPHDQQRPYGHAAYTGLPGQCYAASHCRDHPEKYLQVDVLAENDPRNHCGKDTFN